LRIGNTLETQEGLGWDAPVVTGASDWGKSPDRAGGQEKLFLTPWEQES
jgi:hypothetical protein